VGQLKPAGCVLATWRDQPGWLISLRLADALHAATGGLTHQLGLQQIGGHIATVMLHSFLILLYCFVFFL